MKRAWWSIVVVMLLLLAHAADRSSVAAQGNGPAVLARARRFIASRYGITSDTLRVVHTSSTTDPVTGQRVLAVKVLDTATGLTYSLLVADARVEAMADRRAAVRAALTARRKALDDAVEQQLAARGAADQTAIPVLIWLKEQPAGRAAARPESRNPRDDRPFTDADVQALRGALDEFRAGEIGALVDPVVGKLRARGHAPAADRFSPALAVSLSPAELRDVATWPEVDRIYADEVAQPELEIARVTLKASIVNNRGLTGTSVRVGLVEVGGRIASSPYLELTQDATNVCPTSSTHSTGVAGLINSAHPSAQGVAPGSLLWAGGSCSGNSSQLLNRSTAAADWGARAINLSWGVGTGTMVPGVTDRFYDDMVLNRRVFIVKSAGNRNGICAGDGRLTSPALAYNILTVGGFDDRNTTTWTDDVMDDCSSYVNPQSTSGDREKPEVAAPSMNINSTLIAGTIGNIGSGTSFATGLVTGVSALLMQRAPVLQFWPEALKAILMATAVHNVEGDRRLSDKDGAGGLSVDRADDVVRRRGGDWNGLALSCDENTPLPAPIDVAMALEAGRQTRAVIAWDNDPGYALYDSQPGADLDLTVLDSLGATVATSASLDNTFEIIDFLPASDGTYTLRITTTRCEVSPRYLGWAWWRAGA